VTGAEKGTFGSGQPAPTGATATEGTPGEGASNLQESASPTRGKRRKSNKKPSASRKKWRGQAGVKNTPRAKPLPREERQCRHKPASQARNPLYLHQTVGKAYRVVIWRNRGIKVQTKTRGELLRPLSSGTTGDATSSTKVKLDVPARPCAKSYHHQQKKRGRKTVKRRPQEREKKEKAAPWKPLSHTAQKEKQKNGEDEKRGKIFRAVARLLP